MTWPGDVLDAWARLLSTLPDPVAGRQVAELERELANRFGVAYAVALSSGTAALHTALVGLGIGPGDEVLVPALSVVMSAAPIVYTGARPVFVDCTPDGRDLDYLDAEAKTSDATRAVMPVHLWGRLADPRRLLEFAVRWRLHIIEDACQAQGSRAGDRLAGTLGAVGCFSLKDGKIMWSGEGGYLLTDDPDLADRCRAYRSHWQTPPSGQPPLAKLGHNYRLAEPLAVLARANLDRFDELLARRRHQTSLLLSLLDRTPGIVPLHSGPDERWNGYAPLARLTLPAPRRFCERLAALGVPNSVGTFRLVPTDQRPAFSDPAQPPCRNAAAIIDTTLAVVVTDHDSDRRIADYAETITQEACQWVPA
jgi:dTDP-4-amino-4,6-dideoxygalactose transaminase